MDLIEKEQRFAGYDSTCNQFQMVQNGAGFKIAGKMKMEIPALFQIDFDEGIEQVCQYILNKPLTIEELKLDPPKEKEEIQIEELAVDGICGVY